MAKGAERRLSAHEFDFRCAWESGSGNGMQSHEVKEEK